LSVKTDPEIEGEYILSNVEYEIVLCS